MSDDKQSSIQIGSIQGSSVNLAQNVEGNVNQTGTVGNSPNQKALTTSEVADLISKLEDIFSESELPEKEKQKSLAYLSVAKEETQAKEPDKQFATKNLQKTMTTLKQVNESLGSCQDIWEKIEPVIKTLSPWLGVAAKSLLFL